jgi:F0F1-type ATP synthase epsilon subunit
MKVAEVLILACFHSFLAQFSNIPAVSGDMGILANHVPTVEALRPGLVEVIESAGSSKKFFGASSAAGRTRSPKSLAEAEQ